MDRNCRDFAKGLKLHQAGDLNRAEQIYRRVLRSNPWHADAQHLLGVIAHQRGDHELAIETIAAAIAIDPANPVFHNNLGAAYQALGRLDDAVESYQQSVQLDPDSAQAQFTLGLTLLCQKNWIGAQARFQQAIRLRAGFAEAHFNLGITYQEQERWPEAGECYAQAIRVKPDYADAHHNLGAALHRQGRMEEAVAAYKQALHYKPDALQTLLYLGTACQMLQRPIEAVTCYQACLKLRPASPEVYNNLGILAQAEQRFSEAHNFYEQALAFQPDYFEARYNLGTLCELLDELDQAGECYRRVLHTRPDSVTAHNNLGNILNRQGRLDEAACSYENALRLAPNYAEAHLNLGNVRTSQGRPLEAAAAYMHALEIRPDYVEALNNLGTALTSLGRYEQAIESLRIALRICPGFVQAHNNLGNIFNTQGRLAEAESCYRAAIQAAPDHATSYNNLGAVLNTAGRLDEAAQNFRRAIELAPDYADAHSNLAAVLQVQGRLLEAEDSYHRALILKPSRSLGLTWATMLPPIYESYDDLLEWRESFSGNLARLAQDGITLDLSRELLPVNFYLPYQGFNDCELQRQIGRLHALAFCETHASEPQRLHRTRSAADRRIRVGFISKYFRSHTIGQFMQGIIAHLSRADFHVTVLSAGTHTDETAMFINRHADSYVLLPDQVPVARELVAAQELDVLCYADIGMDPLTYTLAFSRLAPVQCVTWGHPVTTGIPNIDYFLSSELLETADAARHYTETLVRLRTLPTYYYRPAPALASQGRAAFGLPEQAHVYLCPQSLFKFHPDFDTVLSEILRRDPAGCLALVDAPHEHWKVLLSRRLRQSLGHAWDRVCWVPRQDQSEFLNLMAVCDVILDPLHFGGGNTSYQALAVGTPVVTLPSPFLRGRVTAGCYRKMGHTACITASTREYIELALRLGTDVSYREKIRAEILSSNSVLFEDISAVREFEQFFRTAVDAVRGNVGRAA